MRGPGRRPSERNAAPIRVESLYKHYGRVEAVQGVTFTVERGRIFGLIGPDGGGKTTIMRIVVSLLSRDAGEVLFEGVDVAADPGFVRSHIGYMPQRFSLYQDLTVEENLRFFGRLFRMPGAKMERRIDELYTFSGLEEFKRRRAGALSGGMKQKLALSCMLVHDPGVIVLDEPTFGVDPVSRHEFWGILKRLAGRGTTILISTGYMDEALLCDRVALVYRGRILAADNPERLRLRFPGRLYLAASPRPHRVLEVLQGSATCRAARLFGEGVHFTVSEGASTAPAAGALAAARVPFEEIRPIEPRLEDLFLELMQEMERADGGEG